MLLRAMDVWPANGCDETLNDSAEIIDIIIIHTWKETSDVKQLYKYGLFGVTFHKPSLCERSPKKHANIYLPQTRKKESFDWTLNFHYALQSYICCICIYYHLRFAIHWLKKAFKSSDCNNSRRYNSPPPANKLECE